MKKLLGLLAVVAIGLAGVAYWVSHSRHTANSEGAYTFARVERDPIVESISASGGITPRDVLVVGSPVSGRVTAIFADFNYTVEEGDVLLKLDDRLARQKLEDADLAVKEAEAAVRMAESNRDSARAAMDYLKSLENVGFKKERIDAQAKLDLGETALRLAQVKVDRAKNARQQAELGLDALTIKVPVVEQLDRSAGKDHPGLGKVDVNDTPRREKRKYLVMDRKVRLNELIQPPGSGHLFTLVNDLAEVQLQAQVAEGDISKVQVGQQADFTVSAYSENDLHFKGTVSEVRMLPASELGAIFYKVLLHVPNQRDSSGNWQLRPGMTASVDIIRRKHDDAWKMPTSALNFQLEDNQQSEAARTKLARWQERKDRELWKPVWVLDAGKKPYPMFVRLGGKNLSSGETGIRDAQFVEVLEWDPELSPQPAAGNEATYPRVINGAPPSGNGGLFKLPNIKF